MHHSFFILPSTDGQLGWFQNSVIINNVVMNIEVHIFFHISVSRFLGQIPTRGITGWKGSFFFNFLRKFHTVFHNGCTILYSYQQCNMVCFSPHPCQHFLFVDLLMIAIQASVRPYLIVALIWICLMISDVEHFSCLLVIPKSYLEKCLYRTFAHFLNWIICLPGVKLYKPFIYFGN